MAGNMEPPPPPPGGPPPGPPPGAGGGAAKGSPSPAEIIIMVAGAVMLIASFLPFYEFESAGNFEFDIGDDFEITTDVSGGGTESFSAWSGDGLPLFPLSVLIMLYGLVAAVHVALTRFAGTKLPDRVLSFSWPQLHLVLGFLATLTMLAYLILDSPGDKGIGMFLMLLGAIGVLVGAVMEQQQSSARFGDAR